MSELYDYKDVYMDQIDLKGALTGYAEGDPPLLQELGIDFGSIFMESRVIFEVFNRTTKYFNCKTAGNTGPLLFSLCYSLFLMLSGKIHFGYIYFLSLVSNIFMYALLNVLAEAQISFLESFCVMGYSQIPVTVFAFLNIFLRYTPVPMQLALGVFFALWSSATASLIFVKFLEIDQLFYIVAYPLFLIYFCFVLIAIF